MRHRLAIIEAIASHRGTAPWRQSQAKEHPMSTILVLNSSVSGDTSVSRILVEEAVSRLLEADPGATVVQRDLGAAPIPHLTTTNLAGVRGVPATDAELAARALSDQLLP